MVWIKNKEYDIKFKEPDITVENVQYYCHHLKELKQPQRIKSLKFVEADCIRYVGNMGEFKDKYSFICLPLNTKDHIMYEGIRFDKRPFDIDYNTRIYTIAKSKDYSDTFECNCQAWQTKHKKRNIKKGQANCSHVGALYACFKIGRFRR